MEKVLITGIAGQTGSYLADYILENHDCEVHGIVRYRSDLSNLEHNKNALILHDCELRDAVNVYKIIDKIKPDIVFHLAATSFVRSSWDQPVDMIVNNVTSQINLFEALVKFAPGARVLVACSSEQFGKVKENEVPITEKNELRPLSPYAVSKCAQENLAFQYHESYNLHTIITRTFNHTSPRRTDVFVESSFSKQIAEIEHELREPIIFHGNLDSVRDYTDARDIAKAYWLAVQHCNPGEPYNICSDMKVTINDLLDLLLSNSTHDSKIDKVPDPDRMRPSDVTLLYGCSKKFRKKTGWMPTYKFEQTMIDLLNAWRNKISVIKLLAEK